MTPDFLVATYATERLKTLTVWSLFRDEDLPFRPASRARSVREQMVHQCLSEDAWFGRMLGIETDRTPLPGTEARLDFIEHYAETSGQRLSQLERRPESWFDESTAFFAVARSRGWILVRRIAHSAHHRGQLTVYLRLLGRSLYSTYGPTADTGGLPADGAQVIYRYPGVADLVAGERGGGVWPRLPDSPPAAPTERPD
jgi:uncharacterized damage-inducible protein DinB